MIYAGIGSRKTPHGILTMMQQFGRILACKGYILRSGGASGADTAFEYGHRNYTKDKREIYFPSDSNNNAMVIASKHHPYWRNLKHWTKKLMARNAFQILGRDLKTPSDFVLCWTPDGCEHYSSYKPSTTGGTGLAISIASKLGITVYNLKNSKSVCSFLKDVVHK